MQPTRNSATSWTASDSIPTFWRVVAKVQVAATLASTGVPANCLGNSSDHRLCQEAKSAPLVGADILLTKLEFVIAEQQSKLSYS